MKKKLITALIIGGVLLFLGACASEQIGRVKETSSQTVQKKETEIRTERVVEEVQLVEKELSYYWDGVLATYRVYKYADEGIQRLEEVLYNSDDQMQERIVYKYGDGRCREMQTFDGTEKLRSFHKYRYDSRDLLVEDAFFNAEGELQTRQEYKYNEDGYRTRWNVYNGEGALLSYTLYLYENGLNTRIENYSPSGAVLDYFTLEYNSMGAPVKKSWYSPENKLEESREYRYEKGSLVEETVFRGNGSVLRKIRYSNNRSGNPVEKLLLDGGGDIREQILFEYINRTTVTHVKVEG